MCGIYVSISGALPRKPSNSLTHLLCNRGPDHYGQEQVQVKTKDDFHYWISFTSTVLSLRGGQVTPQPHRHAPSGSVFCWNGEAWKLGSEHVLGNDGAIVFDQLLKASSHQSKPAEATILDVLRSISGPFAFVFFDKPRNHLYFGRDRLGRRSLLFKSNENASLLEISSTSDSREGPWQEIESDGIYKCLMTKEISVTSPCVEVHHISNPFLRIYKHEWVSESFNLQNPSLGVFNMTCPVEHQTLDTRSESVESLRWYLDQSLSVRISNVPPPPQSGAYKCVRIAVLFSGGLDCTVLARIMSDILPANQEIDLLNVAFENPRISRAVQKTTRSKGIEVGVGCGDEIDVYEQCPDRKTGRRSFFELHRVCPNRRWRFVAINIPYSETIVHRQRVIDLIYPHNTEMDLSIAFALYFAARGTGLAQVISERAPSPYTTPARVLISGLGADELFGGYTRHATAFRRRGFLGLLEELKLDVDRLGKRNLGRDDRVISHWGKEVRFPFLDEDLVRWAVERPILEKCAFQISDQVEVENQIEPGKTVLRLLAYKLDMHSTSVEKKRAIQFGARTARMEVGKVKGTATLS